MQKFLQMKWSVILIAVFCSLLWGSAFPLLKVSYEEFQIAADDIAAKIVFAGLRFLLAGMIVLTFLLISNLKHLYITKKQLGILAILGLVQTALQYFFFYNGLAHVTGMQGAILNSSGTFLTVLLAHYFYVNDKMSTRKALGLLAGFLGIIAANWGQDFTFQFTFMGEGFMILSGLTSAFATILAKELAKGIHPFAITGWQFCLGALFLLIIGLPQLDENAMIFTPFGWGLFIYSALLSAVAFALWYSLLKYNPAGEISMYKFIVPVSGSILSTIFIPGENLTPAVLIALALVAMGIIIVNTGKKEVNRDGQG
ncbi:DMT family transporter [Oceanobacillus luteolus]|uniref:DMT family transporter n=1 Tax=Oceanobacillus luteolus TaxID=1274358 RepID=A0ABW4HWX1_9BACI|nr:DMT family transporter [Oceanobacillus luteolus]MCM3741710.1 DMT family transporter [Oceanobacillus luteolus]